jgi:hypothetical protein
MNNQLHGTDEHQKIRLVLVVSTYDSESKATRAVEKLIEKDFPADRISLLHKSGGFGDDMLGLTYSNTEDRMKVWGEHGAFWGALWGLLAGATGLFVFPGIGALMAAGPVVEALGGAIAGATLGGGAMAGAAAVTELASALHRIGIPETALAAIHNDIEKGQFTVILHCAPEQAEKYAIQLRWDGADTVVELPIEH